MTDEGKFERQIKQVLQDQTLDKETQEHLDQARHLAVAASKKGVQRNWRVYATAASVALIAVMASVLINPQRGSHSDFSEDMELLMVEENFELIEDLEFYQWISVINDES